MRILFCFFSALLFLAPSLRAEDGEEKAGSVFLVGNSLTWDTVPSKLDGDVQWHVDCGKPLPFIFENPETPCVKSSTLWPQALNERQYDVLALQVHYGSTVEKDAAVISELIELQPGARIVIHTGWARHAEREKEWMTSTVGDETTMKHNNAYFDRLLAVLREAHPERKFSRTRAMDMLQQVDEDVRLGKAPVEDVTSLYRDKVHMNVVTGRYLMHNAMRHALGQKRSDNGFEKLERPMKKYLNSVLDRVLASVPE